MFSTLCITLAGISGRNDLDDKIIPACVKRAFNKSHKGMSATKAFLDEDKEADFSLNGYRYKPGTSGKCEGPGCRRLGRTWKGGITGQCGSLCRRRFMEESVLAPGSVGDEYRSEANDVFRECLVESGAEYEGVSNVIVSWIHSEDDEDTDFDLNGYRYKPGTSGKCEGPGC